MVFPTVSIIIPNWNLKDDCLECLASIEKLDYPRDFLETIVVDNASSDGSVEAIRGRYPWARVLALEKNYGYAGGVNRGVEESQGDYLLILNNDTVLDRDFLKKLVQVAERDEVIGVVGPKVYFYDQPGVIEKVYGRIDPETGEIENIGRGEPDEGQYDEVREVDSLVFVALLVKRAVFDRIGFLDERYFILYEDVDFFIRLKRAGVKMVFAPQAKIWHKGSKSLNKIKPRLAYYSVRNKLLARSKFSPLSFGEHLKNLRFVLSSLVFMLIRGGKRDHFKSIALGIFDFYRGRFGEKGL